VLHVHNKADAVHPLPAVEGTLVCATNSHGLAALREAILAAVGGQLPPEGVHIARTRHVQALKRSHQHLAAAAVHVAGADVALELFAEELRQAHNALGEVTGSFTPDDLLGQIFGRFCIGK
jgi:tRNA modification GTPase